MKHRYVEITKNLTEEDWRLIELFHKRFYILWDNLKDLGLGVFHGSFKKNKDGSYSGGFDLPNRFRLKGLYVDFRHFYLEKEDTNYYKLSEFIASLSTDQSFREFLKLERKNWKSTFVENGWFNFNGRHIATQYIIDLWFNGEIFHSYNRQKIEVLLDLLKIFEDKTAHSILFMAVYDAILGIRNLHRTINDIGHDFLFLKMPIRKGDLSATGG